MIACIDVQYEGTPDSQVPERAKAALVVFEDWRAEKTLVQRVLTIENVEPYESGAFYKRELPCIMHGLQTLPEMPSVVIVDGYVWLGENKPGLGARLHDAEPRIRTVVGVAKNHFVGAKATEVLRGTSKNPLWVAEIGEHVDAAERVREMHGEFRLPTMLRLVDQLCRGNVKAA